MSVNERALEAGPRKLQRIGEVRNTWAHVIPESLPHEVAFDVEYWRRISEQVRAGDTITAMTWDRRIQFEIFVLEANPQSDPPRLDLCFRAIFPPTLKVPAPIVEAARWHVKQRTTDGLFYIYDTEKGEVIADQLRREAAQQQIALLEKLARETAKAA